METIDARAVLTDALLDVVDARERLQAAEDRFNRLLHDVSRRDGLFPVSTAEGAKKRHSHQTSGVDDSEPPTIYDL
jgi:hypothetical protein